MIKSDSPINGQKTPQKASSENIIAFTDSIKRQAETLAALSGLYLSSDEVISKAQNAIFLLKQASTVVVTGVGKSGHIGSKISATFSSTGTTAIFVHPTEASHGDMGMIPKDAVVLALSNSGETRELSDIIRYCDYEGIPIISITATGDNTLARKSEVALLTEVTKETACHIEMAPMNSTTATLVLGDALATVLMMEKNITQVDFKKNHPGGSLGDELATVEEQMQIGEAMPIVSLDATVKDSLAEKRAKSLGCCIVCNDGQEPVGIFTDGMYSGFLENSVSIENKNVSELMAKEPKTLPIGTSIKEATQFMAESGINHIPIVDRNDILMGVFTFHSKVK